MTAAPPRVALLEVHADAPACVALDALRADVRGRLGGRDPFDDAAPRRVELRWSRRQREVVARIDVIEADGQRGERILLDKSCTELVPAVALAIAIAIDPRVALGPLPPEPARVARTLESERRMARATLDEPPPRPAPAAPWWTLGGVTSIGFGGLPGPAITLAAHLELGAEWRVAFEGGIGAGMPAEVGTTSVTALGVTTHVQACHVDGLSVCAGLAYAHMRFGANAGLATPVDEGRDLLAALVTVGVRATNYLRIELGLAVPLTARHTFMDGDALVWRAWPVQPSLRALVTL